jgi:hypothetical protein
VPNRDATITPLRYPGAPSQVSTTMNMTRTDALRALEEEVRQARERFERVARKFSDVWAAYEIWRNDRSQRMDTLVERTPELTALWSNYLRLATRLKDALARPSWPSLLGREDPTPPGSKKVG